MLISAKVVNPRKVRVCCNCSGPIVTRALRMYGAAHHGDKPYVLWSHSGCCVWSHPKIIKAKQLAGVEE